MEAGPLPVAEDPPQDAAWVHGHAHEPNPLPPGGDGDFVIRTPWGAEVAFTVAGLEALTRAAPAGLPAPLAYTEMQGCLIVSTGHGTSGPFTFGGVLLADALALALAEAGGPAEWRSVDVVSADGFGTRLRPEDLREEGAGPIMLAWRRDGQALRREQGLLRLIARGERDDALRQVKWVARIEMV